MDESEVASFEFIFCYIGKLIEAHFVSFSFAGIMLVYFWRLALKTLTKSVDFFSEWIIVFVKFSFPVGKFGKNLSF